MIKGIIFDMDGVMIDSELQSNLGWLHAAALEQTQMPMWLIDSFKGAPAKLSAQFFDEYYKGTKNYWSMRELRTEHVYKIREKEGIPVKPGLIHLLEYIKNSGMVCAVATSTRKESAEATLHNIGAWDYLSAVVYGDQVEHGKPEPDIFLMAAEKIGLAPEECVVIEDSINGIKAGYAAGMKVIHIPDTIEIEDSVRELTSVVCHSLGDVPAIVDCWKEGRQVDVSDYAKKAVMNLVHADRVKVKNTFAAYTDKYDSADPKIKLKTDHTYRVAALCERIAKAQGLPAYDVEIAWLMGMFHDVGRFEQIRRYNTFFDADSVDHAQFGADILFKDGLVNDFLDGLVKCTGFVANTSADRYDSLGEFIYNKLNKSDIEIIELAVRCHSMYRIPEGLTDRERTFCEILRDADKIDILKVNIETPLEDIYNCTTEELRNCTVTKEVMDDFFEEHAVRRFLKKTPVDNVVGHISLTFELVFGESLRIMVGQGYLDKMMAFKSFNSDCMEQFVKIREIMNNYVSKRLEY